MIMSMIKSILFGIYNFIMRTLLFIKKSIREKIYGPEPEVEVIEEPPPPVEVKKDTNLNR